MLVMIGNTKQKYVVNTMIVITIVFTSLSVIFSFRTAALTAHQPRRARFDLLFVVVIFYFLYISLRETAHFFSYRSDFFPFFCRANLTFCSRCAIIDVSPDGGV
jgi:hypothetical protein